MSLKEIIEILKQVSAEVHQKYRAKIKGIFGSYVRGEEYTGSDIDVLVEFESDADLIHYVGLSLFLEERLGLKVDIVPDDTIRAEIKQNILNEAVYL